jgi:hypothetical protein
MLTQKTCVAVNTGYSASVDNRICVPVTFVAGNNFRSAVVRFQYKPFKDET